MQPFVGWILSIFGVIVISVVVDLLFSDSKVLKIVKSICSTVTLLVIITPLISFVSSDGSSFDFSSYKAEIDKNYLNYVNELKANTIEDSLEKMLKQDGVSNADVEIETDRDSEEFTILFVKVNLSKSVIDEKIEHINRNDLIVGIIKKHLNVDKSMVSVYG